MIEFIVKIIEAAAKYAWGVLAVCLFVLFLPHKQACSTGIATLKDQYLGYWWIMLVFSLTICLGNIYSKIVRWFGERNLRIKEERKEAEERERIIKRLDSLDINEQTWIACCLIKKVQTLYANEVNPTANSLLSKGIVTVGSGSILSLPYHIQDFVWEYLLAHADKFLPPEARKNPQKVIGHLKEFEESLKRLY